MSDGAPRSRPEARGDDADQWLIDAACNAGHAISLRERTPGTTAWRALLNAGIPEDEVLRLACVASGAEPADFTQLSPSMGALLPHGVALTHRVVPLGLSHGVVLIATSNPRSVTLERTLGRAANARVQLQAGSPSDIIRAQGVVYGGGFTATSGARVLPTGAATSPATPPHAAVSRPISSAQLPMVTTSEFPVPGAAPEATAASASIQAPPRTKTPDAPVIAATVMTRHATPPSAFVPAETLADKLIAAAMTDLASEVILDPIADGGLLVRMRIDGTVHDRFRIADDRAAATIASLKQLARVESSGAKRANCTATIGTASGPVAVRVRTERVCEQSDRAQSGAGERLVLALSYARGLTGVAELGLSAGEQQRVRALLGETGGLVVIAGPVGSGKTATSYATARELSNWGRLVSTVEESIEYPLAGVAQLQLGTERRKSLSDALRSASATTDDVVSSAVIADATLDAPTFEECARAAARGQLVIATLVASDLGSALAHLRALHPDGAPLAESLRGVVLQRLLRRLCAACASPQLEKDLPALERQLLEQLDSRRVKRAVGCAACHGTGYRGRFAIVEVVPVTTALRQAIARRAVATELLSVVRAGRVPTLWDSGIEHVLAGTTSLAELLDAVPPPESSVPQADFDAMLSEALAKPQRGNSTGRKGRSD